MLFQTLFISFVRENISHELESNTVHIVALLSWYCRYKWTGEWPVFTRHFSSQLPLKVIYSKFPNSPIYTLILLYAAICWGSISHHSQTYGTVHRGNLGSSIFYRDFRHTDWRSQGSNHSPSDSWMTCFSHWTTAQMSHQTLCPRSDCRAKAATSECLRWNGCARML